MDRYASGSNVFKSIHIPGAKHYRVSHDKKIFIFSGISRKQFRDRKDARVVGYFTAKAVDPERKGFGHLFQIKKSLKGRTEKVEYNVTNTAKKFCRTVCYVPVGGNDFLAYQKSALLYMAPAAAVACLALVGAYMMLSKTDANLLGLAPTVNIGGDGKQEEADEGMIDFAGYDDIQITADNPYVYLQNPDTNDVYFSYVVYDDAGREIMTTDLIPPGRALQWEAANDLAKGDHKVSFHVDTFDMEDTSIPYNAMNYDSVKVHVN